MSQIECKRRTRGRALFRNLNQLAGSAATEGAHVLRLLLLEILYLNILLFQKSRLTLYRGILLCHLLFEQSNVLAKYRSRTTLVYQLFNGIEWIHGVK